MFLHTTFKFLKLIRRLEYKQNVILENHKGRVNVAENVFVCERKRERERTERINESHCRRNFDTRYNNGRDFIYT